MNYFIFMCELLTISSAASIPEDAQATIDYHENINDGPGNTKFSFSTSNGIARREASELVNVGQADEHIVVQGEYSYTGTDGNLVEVHYIADKNGYHIVEPPEMEHVVGVPEDFPKYVVGSLLG